MTMTCLVSSGIVCIWTLTSRTHHGSLIFQHLGDDVCYVMYSRGFKIIDYIDDKIDVCVV